MKMTELQTAIKKFNRLISQYPDNKDSEFNFSNFLKQFLRYKSTDSEICIVSFITIIKYEKPIIYYELRKRGEYDNVIDFIVHLTTDYEKAKNNLQMFTNESKNKVIVR
ncbi:hypothetical protein [Metabacillus litoralis]|uniref:hypothetical protein n=1 Tax=Metabacillus litoralis TaxID=152268 RepID=UPI00203F7D8A|nr:hypothetical protein [Metabacillus litoralis]MCM3411215.1 hypothetical protein [Metabacillus litoralis]